MLVDQDKCRGWRMCISAARTRRSTSTGRAARPKNACLCYPRIEAGQPTVCSETRRTHSLSRRDAV
ncbi:hypothetical protein ACTMU2_25375 [Cupriavidus basilensis]